MFGMEKRRNGSDVLPIPCEQVRLHVELLDGFRNELAAEVDRRRVMPEQLAEHSALEHVDTHRRDVRTVGRLLRRQPERCRVDDHMVELFLGGLLPELDDAAGFVRLEQTEIRRGRPIRGNDRDREIRARLHVPSDELPIVHAIEVVAREDEQVLVLPLLEMRKALADRVRRPLEPVAIAGCLLRRQNLDEPVRETAEPVRSDDMSVERGGVELRENEDTNDVGIDAVADGDVDESVLPAKRNGGLGAEFREWEQSRTLSPAEDHCEVRLVSRPSSLWTFRSWG